jgi:hypothetical protein
MLIADLIVALAVAFILSLLFVPLLGWGRHEEAAGSGLGGALLFFFFVVFLAAWAGGSYIRPIGPPVFGVYWLGFLLVGIVIALVLSAAVPPHVRWTGGGERSRAVRFGVFFWALTVALLLTIALAYVF